MTTSRKLSLAFVASMLLCSELLQPFVAASSQKNYNEKCSHHGECESLFCNPLRNECDCVTLAKEKQFYDHDLKMCLSRVGQLCTLETTEDDGLLNFACAPNAECTVNRYQTQSREKFGTCSCKPGHQPREDSKRCMSKAELRTATVSSMDQVKQAGWNRSGSNSVTLGGSGGVFVFASVLMSTIFCSFPFR